MLFGLRIVTPRVDDPSLVSGVSLKQPSVLNLNIENLFTPSSIVANSIGFLTLPAGYTFFSQSFPESYTLTGSMNIRLTKVFVGGMRLRSGNAATVGKLVTNGDGVNIEF